MAMTFTISAIRALTAASILYTRASADCSLEGCNVYMEAARKLAPDLFSDGWAADEELPDEQYYVVKPTYEPRTLSGIGHPRLRGNDYLPKVIIRP